MGPSICCLLLQSLEPWAPFSILLLPSGRDCGCCMCSLRDFLHAPKLLDHSHQSSAHRELHSLSHKLDKAVKCVLDVDQLPSAVKLLLQTQLDVLDCEGLLYWTSCFQAASSRPIPAPFAHGCWMLLHIDELNLSCCVLVWGCTSPFSLLHRDLSP
ncbi:hypothetical protein LR48_Vigan08g001300 [Vigna angularis]|uniref:Uncharacterized protein n=2 Tax=Phaseolus angularis TaxID=3914 RepID=A0A0L9V2L0_PHAAN|nr:hypothetical protein LR48_Vigan08g001300 [Vigna angularis]BAT89299.1 hypothetical protein VIGAN_06022000 [Vigna angularis var. angularis]